MFTLIDSRDGWYSVWDIPPSKLQSRHPHVLGRRASSRPSHGNHVHSDNTYTVTLPLSLTDDVTSGHELNWLNLPLWGEEHE